jgi:single-strand DNA-binding protein
MASFNKVLLLGNLTRDPALRYTPSGTPVASFGLAVNTPRPAQSSNERTGLGSPHERRDDVCFVDVVAFGRQAETASEYLSKGRAALIEGRLQWRSWDGQDGQKRSKHEVIAERIQFMPRGREEGMERPSPGPSPAGEESDMPPLEEDEIPFVRSDIRDGLSPAERKKFMA